MKNVAYQANWIATRWGGGGGGGSSSGPAECEDATLAFQLVVSSGKVPVISRKGREGGTEGRRWPWKNYCLPSRSRTRITHARMSKDFVKTNKNIRTVS